MKACISWRQQNVIGLLFLLGPVLWVGWLGFLSGKTLWRRRPCLAFCTAWVALSNFRISNWVRVMQDSCFILALGSLSSPLFIKLVPLLEWIRCRSPNWRHISLDTFMLKHDLLKIYISGLRFFAKYGS